ncbi:MAG: cob(I)yrinic acid a,c-diamide adenosyltransferase [Candidatus Saliniplasma sp.]
MDKAIIQVYTGDGKGKTTAALGLAIRAAGRGMKVLIIQFLKGRHSGERDILKKIPQIEIESYGTSEFLERDEIKEEDISEVKKGLDRVEQALEYEDWDMLLLDEINVVLDFELLDLDEFVRFLKRNDNKDVEIVLTGRNAPDEIITLASLVTEMRCLKHPYKEGLGPRKGIEY